MEQEVGNSPVVRQRLELRSLSFTSALSREALYENARQEDVHPAALGSTLQNLGFISQQKRLFDIPTTSGADSTLSSPPSDFTPLFFTKAQ